MEWKDLWPLIITTAVGGFIGFIVTLVMSKVQKKAEDKFQENKEEKEEKEVEHDAMREACKEFLRKILKDDLEFYRKQGYCSVEDKAEIDNIYILYNKKLKGNGRGTRYHESIMSLPDEPTKDLEDNE